MTMQKEWRLSPESLKRSLLDLDGPFEQRDLDLVYDKAFELPDESAILEVNPGPGQITCCLALACRGTRKKVYSMWHPSALDLSSPAAAQYVIWHQNVIRKHLVPFIVPIMGPECGQLSPAAVALVFFGKDPSCDGYNLTMEEVPMASFPYGIPVIS